MCTCVPSETGLITLFSKLLLWLELSVKLFRLVEERSLDDLLCADLWAGSSRLPTVTCVRVMIGVECVTVRERLGL